MPGNRRPLGDDRKQISSRCIDEFPLWQEIRVRPHTCSHRCHDDDLKAVDNEDDVMGMEIISVMLMKMMTW